jgi:hypothetical protein
MVAIRIDFLAHFAMTLETLSNTKSLNIFLILDSNYLCEGAVERLVLEWKVQRGRWIDESDGEEIEL